ncbi:MAG: hypothetical protein K8S13_22955 [Desulfobacula sp.]|uniref:hypothetical protein n=1 Tax=Desulfobacula sp. TaxID=2593537 RepID=UPI0025BA6A44|nr:hypothetical protein [Desulfobacula sp.]MCD4722688.1 hypothetical protein [Desulfobacula sp.]
MKNYNNESVLITGGYGVIGEEISRILRERHPNLKIILGGRNPEKAAGIVSALGNAEAVAVDITSKNPLQSLPFMPSAIINSVNDTYDNLLLDCVRQEIPIVDIARWGQRLRDAFGRLLVEQLNSPYLVGSGWMGGSVPMIAAAAAERFVEVDTIDIEVLQGSKDRSGPNSADYALQFHSPIFVYIDGQYIALPAYSNPKKVVFPGGFKGKTYLFDASEHFILPITTGAANVRCRISLDNKLLMAAGVFLMKTGVMKLFGHPRYMKAKHAFLHKPGKGASHQIMIRVAGIDRKGTAGETNITMVCPDGQVRLTACGAVIQTERLMGLDGQEPPGPGVHFPERCQNLPSALKLLEDNGVTVSSSVPLIVST